MSFACILTVGISTTRALRVLLYSALPFELIVLCVKTRKTSHYISAIMSLIISIIAYEVLLLLESTTTSASRKAFYYYFAISETMAFLFRFPNIRSHSAPRVPSAAEYYWRAFVYAHINSSPAVDKYYVFCYCIATYALINTTHASASYTRNATCLKSLLLATGALIRPTCSKAASFLRPKEVSFSFLAMRLA